MGDSLPALEDPLRQLRRMDLHAGQVGQGNPGVVQPDAFAAQVVKAVEGTPQGDGGFVLKGDGEVQVKLMAWPAAPGKKVFPHGQQRPHRDGRAQLLQVFPAQGGFGSLQGGHMSADDSVAILIIRPPTR